MINIKTALEQINYLYLYNVKFYKIKIEVACDTRGWKKVPSDAMRLGFYLITLLMIFQAVYYSKLNNEIKFIQNQYILLL